MLCDSHNQTFPTVLLPAPLFDPVGLRLCPSVCQRCEPPSVMAPVDKCIFYPLQPPILALRVFTPYLLQVLCHMCFSPSQVTICISCMGFWDCCSATPKHPSNWCIPMTPTDVMILCSPGFVLSHAQGEIDIPFAIWTWLHTPSTHPLPALLIKVRQSTIDIERDHGIGMQELWPKEFKRRYVGRCVDLHLCYKIPNGKFNMTKEWVIIHSFLHTLGKTYL